MTVAINSKLAENLVKAEAYLARFRGKRLPHFIAGRHDDGRSGAAFENLTPVDNSRLCDVARGSAADIDAAAQAAKQAFPAWRDMPGEDESASCIASPTSSKRAKRDRPGRELDTGQPIRFMAKAALRAAENFRFFADRAPEAARRPVACRARAPELHHCASRSGPVGVITPWNTPFMLSTWKIAPALAPGCTVVHKPAEWSPLTRDAAGRDPARARGCRPACVEPRATASARRPARR